MQKRLSSIFSSDTLTLHGTPATWWLSLLLAIVLVAGAEAAVRVLLGDELAPQDYRDEQDGEKYEWFRSLDVVPDLVIVGDSTAARNFSPAAIEETLPSLSAFNLGTPGNFQLSQRETAYHLLDGESVPDVVIMSMAAHTYYDSDVVADKESLVRASRAARYLDGRRNATDYVRLARAYDHRSRLVARLRGLEASLREPPHKGFMPRHSVGVPLFVPDTYFDDVPPVPERLETILDLARLAKRRGFRLIVAVPIQVDEPGQVREQRYLDWLEAQFDFGVLDMQSVARMEYDDFSDIYHLLPDGAEKQSRALGTVLAECLPKPDWRACLSDREVFSLELVAHPRWTPVAPDSQDR